MISSLKNNKKKVMLTASIAVILIAALVVVMTLTKPYAVYADGTKVENPYAVKAGGEELFLVKDSKTAEKVIETVMDKYSPEGAQINSITVDKKLSSAVGFKGICRKVLIFALVGIAHILDINVIGTGSALRTAIIFFYISNEGVSLLENAGHLGLPIPAKLKAVLEQLHDRAEKEETK